MRFRTLAVYAVMVLVAENQLGIRKDWSGKRLAAPALGAHAQIRKRVSSALFRRSGPGCS